MKAIRRSPVTRVTAWLLTSALTAPMVLSGHSAKAQEQQVLKIVIADTENRAPSASKTLGVNATAALYNEFAASGLGKFNVVSPTEIRNEATSLSIKVPSNTSAPFNFTDIEWQRIARSLQADEIVMSQVSASKVGGKAPGIEVGMSVQLKDVAAGVLTNGGFGKIVEMPRPGEAFVTEELLNRGVGDAALKSVGVVVAHSVVSATVLNIVSNTVIINRGLRDGYHVGDRVQILHDNGQGGKIPVGEVLIQQAYATDSEAKVNLNPAGISPEDIGRVIYNTPVLVAFVTDFNNSTGADPLPNRQTHSALGMGAIGGTLAVIAVGVLLSSANKGGQVSVTGLTAEPTSQQNSSAVLVRWRDNIFGQGNVLQYKIYREPDFPFVSVGATSGGSGGGGGTGGTTNTAFPVAVRAGVDHSYTDLPSPNFAYSNGGSILVGASNGGLGSGGAQGGGNGGGGGGGGGTLGTIAAPVTLDTGYTPGKPYQYQVTAIILRSIPSSGSSGGGTGGGTGGGGTGGGGGGTGGGGGGTGGGGGGGGTGGGGNSGGSEYVETDPAITGSVTPVSPVQLSTPAAAAGNINAKSFAPTWLSSVGADVFQLEISTDRLFKNPSLVYQTGVIVSTAPFANGVTQTIPTAIDLTVLPQLLANPAFANFVAQTSGASPSSPLIYWRVGARHDEDSPGPLNWITNNSNDPDRTFRWVYSLPVYFTAAPGPPAPPSKAANRLNQVYTSRGLLAPTVGTRVSGRSSGTHVLSPQAILTGNGRTRN